VWTNVGSITKWISFFSETTSLAIKALITLVETDTSGRIVILRSDNGGEYMSKELIQWIASEGIVHQTSTAKPPEKNRVAERYNRKIFESAKSMLHSSTLELQSHVNDDTIKRLAQKKTECLPSSHL
jgi:transposase InsO family protein